MANFRQRSYQSPLNIIHGKTGLETGSVDGKDEESVHAAGEHQLRAGVVGSSITANHIFTFFLNLSCIR